MIFLDLFLFLMSTCFLNVDLRMGSIYLCVTADKIPVHWLQFSHLQVRIGIIYLLSGFGGSVLSALFLRNHYISVGASGALFGLLGSMLSELIMNWTIYSNKVSRIEILV